MGRPRKLHPTRRPSSGSTGTETNQGHTAMPANDRERDRMRVQSAAFRRLKNSLPWVPPDTKLSKLDTLRMACCYINHLADILGDEAREGDVVSAEMTTSTTMATDQAGQFGDSHRLVSLSWPYGCAPGMLGDRQGNILEQSVMTSVMTSVKGRALCGGNVALSSKYVG